MRLPLLEVVGLEHAAVPETAVVPVYGQVLQSLHVTRDSAVDTDDHDTRYSYPECIRQHSSHSEEPHEE